MVLSIFFPNIGGNFAYANGTTEEIPTVTNADPDYPWLGYDAYTKGYPNYDPMNSRYHDLKVNLKGSIPFQEYCFNASKREPGKRDSAAKNWYKKVDGSGSVFTQYAANPSIEGEELNKAILRVLYNGYPNNANGIMNGIEPLNAILVTQNAIWHYSDSQKKDYDKWASQYDTTLEQKNLMTAAIKKLVSANLDEVVTKKVPLTYKLNLFISKDSAYQHLLSADAVPDTPKMPSDRGGDVVEPENPKGDDSKEDSTKSTFKATKLFINKVEKGTDTVVKNAQLTIFKGEDKKDKVKESINYMDIQSMKEIYIRYTKYVGKEKLITYAQTPRIKNATDFYSKVQKVISAGYPSNTLKLQTEDMEGNKNITDTAFKTVTQLAIYYYTDSIDLDTIEHE